MAKKYTEDHEWILIDENSKEAVIGITEKAGKMLEDVVYIALPKIGDIVLIGEEVAVAESSKAATALYTPLSGTISKINEKLKSNPELLSSSSEKEGWLFVLTLSHPEEIGALLSEEEYLSFC